MMTIITDPLPKKHPSRAASSDELLDNKKAKKRTQEVATVQFKAHKEPKKASDLKPKKVSRKASAESSSSSMYSHSHSEPRNRPDQLEVVHTPSIQEQIIDESFRNYDEARSTHDNLLRKMIEGTPLTIAEKGKLQNAALLLHLSTYQLHYAVNIPVDRFNYALPFCAPGEGVNFFSPTTRKEHRDCDFEALNTALNNRLGLIEGQKHSENNAKKLAQFEKLKKHDLKVFLDLWKEMFFSNDPTEDHKEEYNAFLARYQKQLTHLIAFERRVKLLCLNLKGEKKLIKNPELQKCYDQILAMCSAKPLVLPQKVCEAIELHYQPNYLQPLLVKKGRDIINCFEHYHPTEALMASKAAEAWGVAFASAKMPDQLIEWKRVIDGGIVWFIDKDGNVLLEPFQVPEREKDYDQQLNQYVLDCQRVVGEYLYNDGEQMQKLCALIQDDTNLEKPPVPGETLLDGQKRIMDHLSAMSEDIPRFMAFITNIIQKLNDWNHKRGEEQGEEADIRKVLEMQDMLMKFYRAPYQKFVIGPTSNLKSAFKLIYPGLKVDHYLKAFSGEECATNRIEIQFMPFSLDIVYSSPSLICAEGTDATNTLTQKMSLKTSRGGEKLAEPVTVEFLYESPKGLSEDDESLLKKSREKINFVLNSLGYPSMKEHRRKRTKRG